MKILEIINALAAGGMEVFLTHLASELARDHDVTVLSYAGVLDARGESLAGELRAAGVNTVLLNRRRAISKALVPLQMANVIRNMRPDIVHVHGIMSQNFCLAARCLVPWRPSYIYTVHNTVWGGARWMQLQSRCFDHVVLCSEAVLKANRAVLRPGRFTVIPNGIHLSPAYGDGRKRELLIQLGLSPARVIMLNIGSMNLRNGLLQKAQDLTIRAFACSGIRDLAQLVFVGDGTERARLEDLCRSLGVADDVVFCGVVNNVQEYIAASDVVVMPSRFEGLPIAAIEAVCGGRSVIMSDIEAFYPFRAASGNALIPVDNVEALAAELRRAVHEVPRRTDAARQASDAFRQEFDIRKTAQRHLQLYSVLRSEHGFAS